MLQVVAALNPIAGEKMQDELEERIFALQSELDQAHSEVLILFIVLKSLFYNRKGTPALYAVCQYNPEAFIVLEPGACVRGAAREHNRGAHQTGDGSAWIPRSTVPQGGAAPAASPCWPKQRQQQQRLLQCSREHAAQ